MVVKRKKILFFIQSLYSRGAQRQFLELISYLNNKPEYDLMVVLTREEIDYKKFLDLKIPYKIVRRKYIKKDPRLFFLFYKICKDFRPDLIHVWSGMTAFYVLPSAYLLKIPIVNSQIRTAPLSFRKYSFGGLINYLNFKFSDIIISNSKAGIKSFNIENKNYFIVYNGVNLKRFKNLPSKYEIKKKYSIKTRFAVVMVASFSKDKKYNLFVEVAKIVIKQRKDVTFIGVGENSHNNEEYNKAIKLANSNDKILFPGKITDVEALVNACEIGILFTFSEGISNAIIEYMALGKPVIASEGGGTNEIVKNGNSGYIIKNDNPENIANLIIDLFEDEEKMIKMGKAGKEIIHNVFSIEKMGSKIEEIYGKF